jgi:PHP family Zn ribbon phosphoesterase
LGREANLFDYELGFSAIMDALKRKDNRGFQGTLEFFPEEGKYHADGHRLCEVRLLPEESHKHKGLCPKCGKPLTLGVLYRVAELGDRKPGFKPPEAKPFKSVISLQGILGEVNGTGPSSKRVLLEYQRLIRVLGPELAILLDLPLDLIKQKGSELLAEAVGRMRKNEIHAEPGFDGEFGVIRVFSDEEKRLWKKKGKK